MAQNENDGFMDRYLYSDPHEAILSEEMFRAVQQENLQRKYSDKIFAMQELF